MFVVVCHCHAGVLAGSQMGLSLLALVESTQKGVNKVLRYVVEWLGSVICFTVTVPSHHILDEGP